MGPVFWVYLAYEAGLVAPHESAPPKGNVTPHPLVMPPRTRIVPISHINVVAPVADDLAPIACRIASRRVNAVRAKRFVDEFGDFLGRRFNFPIVAPAVELYLIEKARFAEL